METEGANIDVLIVEDSNDDALLLVYELQRGGYLPGWSRVENAEELRKALKGHHWDLVISDHNMPSLDSHEVIGWVKASGKDLPLIVVSGSIGEDLAVAAMKAGAHDYIMKDNLARLVPAVTRELREAESRREHRQAQETIHRLAFHDPLTGLVNRHVFERRLHDALTMSHQEGQHHVLLYMDLDQFKVINDTSGHMAGDEMLRHLASVLETQIRDSDTLARLGGDEFGVLLEVCPEPVARRIAQNLLDAVHSFRFSWDGKIFQVSVSIGMAPVTEASSGVGEILSAADLACYAAKEAGGNRLHLYTSGDAEMERRHGEMQWVGRLNQALEDDRFVLFRQMITPLESGGKGSLCEVLLRMRDRDGSLVTPESFIPAAERYHLMPAIDRWVISHGFEWLASEAGQAYDIVFFNLSATSFAMQNLLDFLFQQQRRYRLDARRIGFEVTETAAIGDLSSAVQLIRALRGNGFQVALDDFGTGMSSFCYLKSLVVDFIKIDGAFVRCMLKDPMDAAIVESINRIGHVAGVSTIAEFVESEDIRRELVNLGVDYAQGFAVDRPVALN